ncbi:MAG: NUDIX hydrolase [Burkholderiaceae bacterium]|nr:NUDIX hydrolase [Burkholderiaceae bacterium]MCO5106792.1 NUDIX hydrolase [Burkholderiaceae bacterium]
MAGDKLFPFVTTDVALFTLDGDALRVLVVKRTNEPERGRWALPGGALKPSLDEDLAASARRVLAEKVRFDIPYLEQVCAFSGRDRDSRGWSISVLFYALLPKDRIDAVAGHKTEAIEWVDPDRPGRELAFDHDRQLAEALAQLRAKIEHDALPLHLLPDRFTLTELQRACEAITGEALDKSAFRRRLKLREGKEFVEVPGEFAEGAHRPAQYYRRTRGFRF